MSALSSGCAVPSQSNTATCSGTWWSAQCLSTSNMVRVATWTFQLDNASVKLLIWIGDRSHHMIYWRPDINNLFFKKNNEMLCISTLEATSVFLLPTSPKRVFFQCFSHPAAGQHLNRSHPLPTPARAAHTNVQVKCYAFDTELAGVPSCHRSGNLRVA